MTSSSFWIEQRPEYYVRTGSMFDNPFGVPRDEILRFIDNNPPEVVAQVVFGKYVESSGLVFTAELINQLFDRRIEKVLDDVWFDEKAWRQGRIEQDIRFNPNRYVKGCDLARKKDYTVIFVLDVSHLPARVVYYKRTNRVPWPSIYAEMGRADYLFPAGTGRNLLDSTGSGGDVILEEISNRLYCPKHHLAFEATNRCSRDGKGCSPADWLRFDWDGYIFTSGSKAALVNHLQACLGRGYDANDPDKEFGALRCPPIYQLEEEMAVYAWDDKKLSTDCVFALALAAWAGLEDPLYSPLAESVYGV